MKFTSCLLIFLFLFSCTPKKDVKDPYQMKTPYKAINLFSQKIKSEIGLELFCYGYNNNLPKEYHPKNGISNFTADYYLKKDITEKFSLDFARNLIVFLVENLLIYINSDLDLRPNLDIYPCGSECVNIAVHIVDENKIDLGQGVAVIYFSRGKIEYEGYKIHKYSDHYPADGEHYTIHEESYAEALEIVKKQGSLRFIQ